MKVRFWGTRGSIPVSFTARSIRPKIKKALFAALQAGLSDPSEIDAFVDKRLPFSVRGAFGSNTSCVEIVTGGEDFIVCDAGTGIKNFGEDALGRRLHGQPGVFHLLLSHLHWDHIQGFPFFAPAYIPGNRIFVYSCHGEADSALRIQQSPPFFPVGFSELGAEIVFRTLEPGQEYEIGGARVLALPQIHPGDSFGFRFFANGRSVIYSTDSEHKLDARHPASPFLEFCNNADLLIFDAQYGFAESQTLKEDWGHSSNIVGVELAKDAGVKHLCLFHQEPSLNDAELESFLKETRRYARIYKRDVPLRVSMAYDGLEITT
jgi:phosphoribosyl 1,2-cyclic phosphodiesterase